MDNSDQFESPLRESDQMSNLSMDEKSQISAVVLRAKKDSVSNKFQMRTMEGYLQKWTNLMKGQFYHNFLQVSYIQFQVTNVATYTLILARVSSSITYLKNNSHNKSEDRFLSTLPLSQTYQMIRWGLR